MKTKNGGLYAYVFSLMCMIVVFCVCDKAGDWVVPQALDAREMKNTTGERTTLREGGTHTHTSSHIHAQAHDTSSLLCNGHAN